jgi:hypothetical protein
MDDGKENQEFGDVQRSKLLKAISGWGSLASALTHSEAAGSRLILRRMVSAGLVQGNGFGALLCSRM